MKVIIRNIKVIIRNMKVINKRKYEGNNQKI